ncbi:hypothetical protein ABGB18_43995 [Nonomuraea sp. B12E4]|uniref:hypothetical protein n=1 Tax=Nonomuraea sp. B12E4 TaxID=3153564 RepID=UPI00325F0691
MNRSWWGWFSCGLAFAGIVTAYVAWQWPIDSPAVPASAFHPSGVESVALLLGTLLALWLTVATVKAVRRTAQHDPVGAPPADRIRASAVTCAVVLGAAAAYHWIQPGAFALDGREAFAAAYGTGLTAAAAGFLGMAIAFKPARLGIAGVLGGSAAVVATSLATLAAITVMPIDSVASGTGTAMNKKGEPVAAVPTSVSRVGWRWKAADLSPVGGLAIAGGGVVVQIADGLVSLNSVTGEERWRYRKPGSHADDVEPSADGGLVMVTFKQSSAAADGSRAKTEQRTALLDAYTGMVLAEHVNPWGGADNPFLHAKGVITALSAKQKYSLSPGVLTGWHPDTSKPAWHYTPPKGCAGGWEDGYGLIAGSGTLARDVFAQLLVCAQWVGEKSRGDRVRTFTLAVLGLDPETGAEAWRRERKVSARPDSVRMYRSADGGALSVTWGEKDGMVLEQASGKAVAQQRTTGVFTAERFLHTVPAPRRERPQAYGWDPFGAGERERASVSLMGLAPSPEEDAETRLLPLEDAMLVAFPQQRRDEVTITVLITPWGRDDTVRIPITLPSLSPPLPNMPPALGLLPAPGAVIVARPPSGVIVGLV